MVQSVYEEILRKGCESFSRACESQGAEFTASMREEVEEASAKRAARFPTHEAYEEYEAKSLEIVTSVLRKGGNRSSASLVREMLEAAKKLDRGL